MTLCYKSNITQNSLNHLGLQRLRHLDFPASQKLFTIAHNTFTQKSLTENTILNSRFNQRKLE